ncbi:MAG: DUF4338 domain-containing protein, partial [Rhodospirillales bacterium]|nr:DUF4338 domain-containing protein [Acetobacter sp.]
MSSILQPKLRPQPSCDGKVIYTPRQIKATGNALRQSIESACSAFELALANEDKGYVRALHGQAKQLQPGVDPRKIKRLYAKHQAFFRQGVDIDPAKIKPVLKSAPDGTDWSEKFMLVRALWSMPYSKGYGRRLRFVVWDDHHEAVVGIIGLQSPPADLSCRDQLFAYPEKLKLNSVNCTMDAYAVGAVPPYSYLLGGKLCAGLIATDPVRQAYWRQYATKRTEMLNQNIRQPLAAVTTTSAFGRSSMYNRLRYGERLLAEPIGYTLGYGTLHLEHLYGQIRGYLEMTDEYNHGGFGAGPKVRWQNITNALLKLGLSGSLLQHGVKREVFLYRLVDDLETGMAGGGFGKPLCLSVKDFSAY